MMQIKSKIAVNAKISTTIRNKFLIISFSIFQSLNNYTIFALFNKKVKMKTITTIIRVLVGLLFMFSGFVKFNDPIGFSYKMEEYFEVFADDLDVQQDSLHIKLYDTRGNEISSSFPVYKNDTKRNVWITSNTDSELMEIGEDTFVMTNVMFSVGNETLFDENYLSAPDNLAIDSIWIEWHLGDDSVNVYAEQITASVNLKNELTLDYSENIRPQPFLSKFFTSLIPYGLWIGMFICIFELVIGFTLLIGYKPVLTTVIMLLMIIFFTFLTGYSAIFNKVTDCGCFGDAIKLAPWETFWKDIVLLVLIIFLLFRAKHMKALFSPGFALKSTIFISLVSVGISVYALMYLPPINFLNFKNGNNLYERTLIPEGQPAQDVMEIIYYYEKGGVVQEFDLNTAPVGDEEWTFVRREEKIVTKAYKPKLDNFHDIIHPSLGDVSEQILTSTEYQLLVVAYDITKSKQKELLKAVKLANDFSKETDYKVWFITSNSRNDLDQFAATHPLDFEFCVADNKFVKSIIRSNPGVILLKGPVVVKNWSSKRIPSFKRIKKRLKK